LCQPRRDHRALALVQVAAVQIFGNDKSVRGACLIPFSRAWCDAGIDARSISIATVEDFFFVQDDRLAPDSRCPVAALQQHQQGTEAV
jgi:hypothetical protein